MMKGGHGPTKLLHIDPKAHISHKEFRTHGKSVPCMESHSTADLYDNSLYYMV